MYMHVNISKIYMWVYAYIYIHMINIYSIHTNILCKQKLLFWNAFNQTNK